jgi:phosphoglycolate phosphatase-like HAD superfamily hydrolase
MSTFFYQYDLLLFDLDGTLTDPLAGISRSINYALEHFGYAPKETSELAVFFVHQRGKTKREKF